MTTLDPDIADSIAELIAREVAAGFTPAAEIVTAAVEFVSGEASPDVVRAYAESRVRSALQEHRDAQSSWPERTDCDRLDAAFAKLDAIGVVARQNFSCCQNCGHGEIWDEINGRAPTLPAARGYVFYHCQDTESAVEGDSLFLAYGSVAESDAAAVDVGHEIVQALRAEGMDPQWNGSLRARIRVPVEWRRRR